MNKNNKTGHRERLKERFMKGGGVSYTEEGLLELLLAYSIPQKDVLPLAKSLLEKFGSLSDVLSAEVSSLCEISGIKISSATLLKLVDWIRIHHGVKEHSVKENEIEVVKESEKIDIKEDKVKQLGLFDVSVAEADTVAPNGTPFPSTLSVNKGILSSIPDAEFRELAENEAKRPEPTAAHVERAFESFLRSNLKGRGLIVLGSLEMLFAYNVELTLLRTMVADDDRVLLLLPGRRSGGKVIMFPDLGDGYALPTNLIADNHCGNWKNKNQKNLCFITV